MLPGDSLTVRIEKACSKSALCLPTPEVCRPCRRTAGFHAFNDCLPHIACRFGECRVPKLRYASRPENEHKNKSDGGDDRSTPKAKKDL